MARELEPSVPNGELRVVEDVPASFAELVATEIARSQAVAGAPEGPFRLVLSGGSTARSCYEHLASAGGIAWAGVECLVGDERCVPADDPDANQKMIREALIDRVTPRPRFVPMDCAAPLEAYESVIRERPQLDLVHLGLGPDGHTASLFPGLGRLEGAPGPARRAQRGRLWAQSPPKAHLDLRGIALARLVVFTVAGADKREALSGSFTTRTCRRHRCGPIGWSGSATGGDRFQDACPRVSHERRPRARLCGRGAVGCPRRGG